MKDITEAEFELIMIMLGWGIIIFAGIDKKYWIKRIRYWIKNKPFPKEEKNRPYKRQREWNHIKKR